MVLEADTDWNWLQACMKFECIKNGYMFGATVSPSNSFFFFIAIVGK